MKATHPPQALFTFAQGLSLLLRSGTPVLQAARTLANLNAESEDGAWRGALAHLARRVENGQPLSTAMHERPECFPVMMVGMARAGEVGGNLGETMARYACYLEREAALVNDGSPTAMLALWCHRMHVLLLSGVPILQSMESSVATDVPDALREAVLILRETIREGQSMGARMSDFRSLFPEHVRQLVRLGETTGTLDDVFGQLAEFLESRTHTIEPIPFIDLSAPPPGPALVQEPAGGPPASTAGETGADRLRAAALGLNFADLRKIRISREAVDNVPGELARRHSLIPVQRLGQRLFLAMADPTDAAAIEAVKEATGLQVVVALAPAAQVAQAIALYYRTAPETDKQDVQDAEPPAAEREEPGPEAADDAHEDRGDQPPRAERERAGAGGEAGETGTHPIIRVVNSIIQQAIKDRASDVHIEPGSSSTRVRFRIDGALHEIMQLPSHVHPPLISRLKVMSEMNVAERTRPQYGRIGIVWSGAEYHLRVMTYPFADGEGAVMRIAPGSGGFEDLAELGMLPEQAALVQRLLRQPCGILAVAGVYGSGRTTTLYTLLRQAATEESSVVSLEDPVEDYVESVKQVYLNRRVGMTFASALRSVMDQDPDVVMVGDVPDAETMAEVTHTAATGHLVLAGISAVDAIDGLERLLRLDPEAAGQILGVVNQRLLRKVCLECRGAGCEACRQTGCRGRTGVFEILANSPGLLRLLRAGVPRADILTLARAEGMIPLSEAAHRKVVAGVVSEEEVRRVLGT